MSAAEKKGRDSKGRFCSGNKISVGHSTEHARSVQQFQQELYKTVKLSDVRIIVKKLIAKAKKGDTFAAEKILDRLLGKPQVTTIFVDESVPKRIRYSVAPPPDADNFDEAGEAIDAEIEGKTD